jgi:hypothetical protein
MIYLGLPLPADNSYVMMMMVIYLFVGNSTGLIDLLLDWYLLSLSDHIFAWRRDTDILSTFAHVSLFLSS